MNRRQKIIISVTGIFIVLLALIGLTYAYFLTQVQGNTNDTSISITTANLRLVYNDGSPNVVAENLIPSDAVYEKTFTVTNEGNANITYGVFMIDVINTFERKSDVKYTMECSTTGTLNCGTVTTETTFPNGISELVTATIEPNKTHTYTFKFTYKDTGTDQSVDMGKELQGKIQIYASNDNGIIIPYEPNTLAFNVLNNGSDVTVNDITKNIKTIKNNPDFNSAANGTSWDEELKDYTNDGLFSTEDNYGTSYYYRGPVSNNYVTFSNKCWRIVRIEGDGSVKLTLESQSVCSEDMESDFSIGNADWGYKVENGKYIGDYKNSTSGMKNKLTTWLNETEEVEGEQVRKNITTSADRLLKTEDWCLGNITNTYAYNSPYGELGTTAAQNYISGTNFYYETGRNLYGKGVTPNATLKCNGETDSSKIGALTADEVVYAGGKAGSANTNYYLHNSSYYWWTLSRSRFYGASDGAYDYAFYVDSNGFLGDRDFVNYDGYVRPAVSLNTGVKIISGGEGTLKNPYIINEG